MVLTEAGQRLQGYATRLVQFEAEALAAVPGATEPAGTLHVGAPESLCAYRLPPLLARFHERHPRVRLVFRPGACTELLRAVRDGSADVAFCFDRPARADGVAGEDLVVEPVRVVAHPGHPLGRQASVAPAGSSRRCVGATPTSR